MINIIPINNLQPYLFFRNYKFLCFLTTQSITKSVSFVLSSDFAATAAASANPLSLTGLGSLNALSGFQPYPAGKLQLPCCLCNNYTHTVLKVMCVNMLFLAYCAAI